LLDRTGITKPLIWGNVFKDDPYKVWTSKASGKFRIILHGKMLPKECRLCALGYKVIC